MVIDDSAYRELVERIGEARYKTSGGECHGIEVGVRTACDVLGIELDTEAFHADIIAVENRLFERDHPDQL